jgi:hypothetical protein
MEERQQNLVPTISLIIKSIEEFNSKRSQFNNAVSIVLCCLDFSKDSENEIWTNRDLLQKMYFIDCIFPPNISKHQLEVIFYFIFLYYSISLLFFSFRTILVLLFGNQINFFLFKPFVLHYILKKIWNKEIKQFILSLQKIRTSGMLKRLFSYMILR